MKYRKLGGIAAAMLLVVVASAQDSAEQLLPLRGNPVLKAWRSQKPIGYTLNKSGIKDTLQLPFFDDFSALGVFPDEVRWTDKQVFINPDFPLNPPSLGAATFDGLDSEGNAYENINANLQGPADTLTSQPIDLSNLSPADNVYLSFFWQAQGRSLETLVPSDSLVLQFKNNNGAWINVWTERGDSLHEFEAAIIRVNDPLYFHAGFQFRWMNYMIYIGNLKQWHIDYVYLNSGRNGADTVFDDQSIASLPQFPLEAYTYMPWKQLVQNPGKYLRDDYFVEVANLNTAAKDADITLSIRDNDGFIGSEQFNAQSLPGKSVTRYVFSPVVNLPVPDRDTTFITLKSQLSGIPGGNSYGYNDSATRVVALSNFYAYDDGTAETGYGIRNSNGSVAYGFELEGADSIRGIKFHFTQAEARVVNGFVLNVWKSITSVGQPSTQDELIYAKEAGVPVYTDTLNGFHYYALDSALFLEKGVFYVGWTQSSSFLINVGFDRNYTINGQESENPNLFYNVGGTWKQTSVVGTPMIRPVLGDDWTISSVRKSAAKSSITVYPNPAQDYLKVASQVPVKNASLIDMQGRNRTVRFNDETVDLSDVPMGVYLLNLELENGEIHRIKLIVQD